MVFRKVDLQILHWISIALTLDLSCDLATLVSFALRSRFCAALAPYFTRLVSISMLTLLGDLVFGIRRPAFSVAYPSGATNTPSLSSFCE